MANIMRYSFIVRNQRKNLVKTQKRNMYTFRNYLRNEFYKGTRQRSYITSRVIYEKTGTARYITTKELITNHVENRNFATNTDWSMEVRKQKPIKGGEEKPHCTIRDRFTGLKIAHPRDISGKQHMLLVDRTYQSDVYVLVIGCFTSTNKVIDGITPIKISDYQFNGEKKDQYFLLYPEPVLMLKDLIKIAKLDVFQPENSDRRTEDHVKFINSLPTTPKDLY